MALATLESTERLVAPAEDESLYASISPASMGTSAIGTIDGLLTRFRAVPMEGDSGVRYVHNLTVYVAGARKYCQCTFWGDKRVDLRELMGKPIRFHWSYLQAARDPKYGVEVGKGLPAVVFNGSIDSDLIERYGKTPAELAG